MKTFSYDSDNRRNLSSQQLNVWFVNVWNDWSAPHSAQGEWGVGGLYAKAGPHKLSWENLPFMSNQI